MVVTLQWSTDRTDVDLHVIEPSGEECCYRHRLTKSGGQMTADVTEGLGPEMFTLRDAPPGKYAVKINYYGSDQNRTGTRTKALVTVYDRPGTRQEHVERHVITLENQKTRRHVTSVKR